MTDSDASSVIDRMAWNFALYVHNLSEPSIAQGLGKCMAGSRSMVAFVTPRTLVAVTLAVGLATVRVPAPWQNYLIVAYATFVGEAVEGLIVDTEGSRRGDDQSPSPRGLGAARRRRRRPGGKLALKIRGARGARRSP